jgi:enterochelin esterase-like enzyme
MLFARTVILALAFTALSLGPLRVRAETLPAAPVAVAVCEPANFAVKRAATETVAGCFISSSTKGPVHYEVTFPAGYDPAKKEPFVIYLHGRGGSQTEFRDFGGAEALDAHVRQGGAPFVVIAPSEPKHSYWKDGPAGEFGTAKMVAEDLVAHVEAMPGIEGGRAHRAIMGVSMGGHGSFYLAEKRPDVFSAVYAVSPVFRAADDLLDEDISAFGKAAQFIEQDPVSIYLGREQAKKDPLPNLRSAVEIGKDDPFLTSSIRTSDFIQKLRADLGPERVNMSRPGGHDSEYWRGAFRRAAEFMGENFTSRGPSSVRKRGCDGTFGRLKKRR